MNIIEIILKIIIIIVPFLISIAYLTLAERKILGAIQLRVGPNTVGPWGMLQPIMDGVKLFGKETILPSNSNKGIYITAPMLSFILAIMSWAVIPFDDGTVLVDTNIAILYVFTISSISVYAILMSGWSSNSKYSFFGSIRAAAQMISYEVAIGIVVLCVVILAGSLDLITIVEAQKKMWNIIPLSPCFIMFLVCALAETNRSPFDLTEGESELVSGFNVEYASMLFALFFLAEYLNIIFMSFMGAILFFGGWLPIIPIEPFTWIPPTFWLAIKASMIMYLFVLTRGTFPRFRYDHLMDLVWQAYLPFSIAYLIFVASFAYATNGLPSF